MLICQGGALCNGPAKEILSRGRDLKILPEPSDMIPAERERKNIKIEGLRYS